MKNYILSILSFLIVTSSFAQVDDELFNIYNERNEEDGSVTVYADNANVIEVSATVEFNVLKNMQADVELPFKTVVPAGSKHLKLLTLTIKKMEKESQLGYSVKHCYGDIYTKNHDDSYVYTIPYKHGQVYSLEQAYGGSFSHYITGRTHALDFAMDVGTTVCAARGGTVIGVKEDSNKGGKTSRYQEYGNSIEVYHGDGSIATYVHLKKNGSKVKVGDVVKAGQEIAYSGNTGWSSGPHLHFQVYTFNQNMDVKSIATKFLQPYGKVITLKKNLDGYTSVHH